jgi:hypothetical protein
MGVAGISETSEPVPVTRDVTFQDTAIFKVNLIPSMRLYSAAFMSFWSNYHNSRKEERKTALKITNNREICKVLYCGAG